MFRGRGVDTATHGGIGYQPTLDGLRAVAVAAVIAYHLGYGWAPGGYLGVDTFFVLSGFLITSLLLAERTRTSRIDLPAFWARRARRLLPALLVVLAALAAYARWWAPAASRGELRGDGLAALFYSANWRFIAAHSSYFDLYDTPSLLEHTWSLAIEEQFYLVWPIVVALCLWLSRGRRAPLAITATGVLIVSALLMSAAAGSDPSRAYFGTDTRVHSLLVGTLLAMFVERRRLEARPGALSALGTASFLAVCVAYATVGDDRLDMYHGGFLVFAVLVAIVIAAAVQQRGPVRAALSLAPLVWVGRISYGLYLWHWPVQLVLTPDRTHLAGVALDIARVAVTLVSATASYYLVELPIRQGRAIRGRIALPSTLAAAAASAGALLVATASAIAPSPAFAAPAAGTPITISMRPVTPSARPAGTGASTTAEALPAPHVIGVIGVIGDSVAASLVPGLEARAATRGLAVAGAAIPGCGATDAFSLDDQGAPFSWSDDCVRAVPEVQQQLVAQFGPDVVVWLSSWETSDRLVGSERVRFGTEQSDAAILRGMSDTLDRVSAGGARVVMLTLPPRAERQDGRPVRAGFETTAHLNGLIQEFAFGHADRVQLIDFANIVCPHGPPCPTQIDGMWLRPDGMHFTDQTGGWAAERLLEILLATPG